MPTASEYQAGYGQGKPTNAAAVTPNDSTDLPSIASTIFVTGAGNIKVTMVGGTTVTLSSTASQYHNIVVSRVWATGTTATGIIALY